MSIVDACKPAAVAYHPGLCLMQDFWIRITRRESNDPAQFASSGADWDWESLWRLLWPSK
ncbi:hypothetical protein B0H65DRAFT_546138 [Neurospora tetraspora]|uniref:Uncharacterized protein n=1 Tax=Neurospora tetraspora TaxID=94610 RepID=A0AAE0JLA3_9PEZI|nr:hypothetical protein B0H65DRAFT_546138 [Neurospora tetraspora]